MKRLGIIMEDELHRELKLFAVSEGKTVTDVIISLVKKELRTKKEQSR